GKAADEAALLERRDEAVDAGFRRQVQCVLHLVEGWRNARFLHTLMDEQEEFLLFARQHGIPVENRETNPEQTLSVPHVFRKGFLNNNMTVQASGSRRSRTSQGLPAGTAGAPGGRTSRPSAAAKTFIIDESCLSNGVTESSPEAVRSI